MSDPFWMTIPRARRSGGTLWSSEGHSSAFDGAHSRPENRGGSSGRLLPYVASFAPLTVTALSTAVLVASIVKIMRLRKGGSVDGGETLKDVDSKVQDQRFKTEADLKSPSIIDDRGQQPKYEKLREIGRGAFGVVYIGRNAKTGELVAIKEMDLAVAEELRTEYRLVAGLTNPHVVEVRSFECGKRHARLYLEWVAGGSLNDIIHIGCITDDKLLASYVRQLLEGLGFLHEHGILHRDVKPRNILVDHTGGLKLTDFGLSRHLDSMHDHTRCAGTPVYMAPECMHGRFSTGSDLWALGATITEMISGRPPWSHVDPNIYGNQVALMLHVAKFRGDPNHHPRWPSTVSKQLSDFLMICFAPLPEQRSSCKELLYHPFIRAVDETESSIPISATSSSSVSSSSASSISVNSSSARGSSLAANSESATTTTGGSCSPQSDRS